MTATGAIDEAVAHWQAGDTQQALTLLDTAQSDPNVAARALAIQADILRGLSRNGESLAKAMQALRLDQVNEQAWVCAAYLLTSQKIWAEACALLEMAVAAIPNHAVLTALYGMALAKCGNLQAGYDRTVRALQLRSGLSEAVIAQIDILTEAGYYDMILQLSASLSGDQLRDTAAHVRGAANFITGAMTYGMRDLAQSMSGWRYGELPMWNGSPGADTHVLLYSHQGFGDFIQFARYVDVARQRVGHVTLQVPDALRRLIGHSFPDLAVCSDGELPAGVTHRCALPVLAMLYKNTFDPLEQRVPYLAADPAIAASWREKLVAVPRPRIGIVWATPWQRNSPTRTVDFAALTPLIELARPHLVSLQIGPEAEMARNAGIFDAAACIGDFADSAGLMNELDLIISLDSAPAHLAGALGKPVWLMLPFSGEWRWLIEREDSIWYKSMRIFRQSQPGDWHGVVERICADAKLFLAGDTHVLKPMPWNGVQHRRHPHALPLDGI